MNINNLIVISDTHFGCKLGLCPDKVKLDEGGTYIPSVVQRWMHARWKEFWNDWVPDATEGEPYAVCMNGDLIDGVHHNSTTQMTQNFEDQRKLAIQVLEPVVEKCDGRFFVTRGTEAHAGSSGEDEEGIAKALGAIPENGCHSRWELRIRVGKGRVHLAHHIGTSGTLAYQSTAVLKELEQMYVAAGRNRTAPFDVIVRSHRHCSLEVRIPTATGYGISVVTPGWQLKTPFSFRIIGGRQNMPEVGGILVRQGKHDLYTRQCVWTVKPPKDEIVEV